MWRRAMIDSFLIVFTLECASSLVVLCALLIAPLFDIFIITDEKASRWLFTWACVHSHYGPRTIRACNDKEIRCIITACVYGLLVVCVVGRTPHWVNSQVMHFRYVFLFLNTFTSSKVITLWACEYMDVDDAHAWLERRRKNARAASHVT